MRALVIVVRKDEEEYYNLKLWSECLKLHDKTLLKVDLGRRIIKEVLAEAGAGADIVKLDIDNDRCAFICCHKDDKNSTTCLLEALLDEFVPETVTVFFAGRKGWLDCDYMQRNYPARGCVEFRQIEKTPLVEALKEFGQTLNRHSFDAVCELIKD